MPKLLCTLIASLLSVQVSFSTNYYVRNGGNDTHTGTSPAQAWASLDRVNLAMSAFLPGDSIFFARGSTFVGALLITEGGTAAKRLYFGAYGTGAAPLFKGSVPVINWTNAGGNIWKAQCPVCPDYPTNLFLDSLILPKGRYPNADAPNGGYLTIDDNAGKLSITDLSLPASPNWTGAEAVVRTRRWIIDRVPVVGHAGNTLTFGNGGTTSALLDGYGYFLLNHPATLDRHGEWAYNASTKTFSVYLTGINPNAHVFEAPVAEMGIYSGYRDYITVENLNFTRYLQLAVYFTHTVGIVFKNNTISETGKDGVYFEDCEAMIFDNNYIHDTHNDGARLIGCDNSFIRKNIIRNIAVDPGLGGNGNGEYLGIHMKGDNVLIEDNLIENIGYNGIYFLGSQVKVNRNIIKNGCLSKDDGAGIYTWSNGTVVETGREITNNIILNIQGNGYGTDDSTKRVGEGIYTDDRSLNVLIKKNTIAWCGDKGIYIHNSQNIDVVENTVYAAPRQLYIRHDDGKPTYPITGCDVSGNVFVSLSPDEVCIDLFTYKNDVSNFGIINKNYLISPQDPDWINRRRWNPTFPAGKEIVEEFAFEKWQAVSGYDVNSLASPVYYPEFEVDAVSGVNIIPNGTFNTNLNGWTCFGSGAGNNCELFLSSTPEMDGKSMQITFDPFTGNSTSLAKILTGPITANRHYLLSYSAKGVSDFGTTTLYLKDKATNKVISPTGIRAFHSERIEQQHLFYTNKTVTKGRLELKISESDQAMWVDNVTLQEATVTMIAMEDLTRFEYNDTHSPKTFTLDKNYLDHAGNAYCSGSDITLAPFTSIVLIEEPVSSTGAVHALTSLSNITHPSVSGCDWKHFESSTGEVFLSINPQQKDLGETSADVYLYTGAIRNYDDNKVLNRSWVIRPEKTPSGPVKVRLYLTHAELNTLILADPLVNDIADLGIFKFTANDAIQENDDFSDNSSGQLTYIAPANITTGSHSGGYYMEFEVSSFSEFWVGTASSSTGFPVEFYSFTVTPEGNHALLDWATASELSNSHFVIERSLDANIWEALAEVPGAGNSDQIKYYQYRDKNPFSGESFYRLRQVDFDGGFSYSEVRNFLFQGQKDFVSVFPNPFSQTLSIYAELAEESPVKVFITDPVGRVVYHTQITQTGSRTLEKEIPLPRFAPGIYMLTVETNRTKLVKKVIRIEQ
ncbi:MAG: right-handed parallel beta-helix repeat-containing protein [Bacteroidia bacterium]|nr:right-handed parallel beta-helix repeat-containing protein [Bacteroidia bacterium]